MKVSRIFVCMCLIAILFIGTSRNAKAQEWVTNGPYGANIRAIAVNPQDSKIVFAGTSHGIFKSADGGATWTKTRMKNSTSDIHFDPSNPQIIYAGADNGFHKSFDGGKTWFTSGAQGNINQIAIDPSNPKILYVASESGLYKGIDGGGFWSELMGSRRFGSVAVHPKNSDIIYAGTRASGQWNPDRGHEFHTVLYKTTDGGDNWSIIFDPGKWWDGSYFDGHIDSIAIDPINPDKIYIGTQHYRGEMIGVFRSLDGGKSWIKVYRKREEGGGPNVRFIILNPKDRSIYIVAQGWGVDGAFRSQNDGDTWQPVTQQYDVADIAFDPSNPKIIYIATSNGLYKSVDEGKSWERTDQGINTPLDIYAVTPNPRAPGVVYAATGRGIYKSSDNGSTWKLSGLESAHVYQILLDPMNKDAVYAASVGGFNIQGAIYKSFDLGESWWSISRGFSGGAGGTAIARSDPKIVYSGSFHGGGAYIYRSAKSGSSWTETKVTDGPGSRFNHVHSLAVDATDPNVVYVYVRRDDDGSGWSIYKSTDAGKSWKPLKTQLGDGWSRPQRIATDPVNHDVVYFAIEGGGIDGINKSEDGGKTWKIVGLKGRGCQTIVFDPDNPKILYAATGNNIYQSKDGGLMWADLGNAGAYVKSIAPDPYLSGVIYAATDAGVYVYKASGDVNPPSQPIGLSGTVEKSNIKLTWQANKDIDLAGYRVYYGIRKGVYSNAVDLGKNVAYTLTDLADPIYYIAIAAYDTSGNQSVKSEELKVILSEVAIASVSEFSYSLSLPKGLNMISLPLQPPIPFTARAFAAKLNSTLVVEYDDAKGEFNPFLPNLSALDGFTIKAAKGYIVNLLSPTDITFKGKGWSNASNAPPLELEKSSILSQPIWAFVVGGVIQGIEFVSDIGSLRVRVRNLNSGLSNYAILEASELGKFAVALVDLSKNEVVSEGDKIEILATDSSGKIVSGPTIRKVKGSDLSNAYMVVSLKIGDTLPNRSMLGQNYPNPFNPETWIPYQLSESGEVEIGIYDVGGKMVKRMELGYKAAGYYIDKSRAAYWDGRTNMGEKAVSGIYFYTIRSGKFVSSRKLLILK